MSRGADAKFIIISSRGDQIFAYDEDEMRETVSRWKDLSLLRHEDRRVITVFGLTYQWRSEPRGR